MGSESRVESSVGSPPENHNPVLLDQPGKVTEQPEKNGIRGLFDFDLASGDESMPVSYLLGDNDPSKAVHLASHL
ncbi:MAG: hypothetical protein A2V99_06300 [Spirochaetes bacterium RBG_16_67_19]|nr:MAG: hypothetical protein A2V99_06290 [Spirochaetes bacterium RBG_16_67_19]OHD75005.1 MAG: hypothetical protein A2V99_06300 [Spirochaetes bacterium RBG_16_67_19]